MMIHELIPRLDGVRPRGSRWSARCPAHEDKSPSLSVSEGNRGILLRCWAGCTLQEICSALGIREADLFFDTIDPNPQKRKAVAQERARQREQRAAESKKQGFRIDALREADYYVRARCGLDISGWSDQRLDGELNVLADAYILLGAESFDDV